MIKNNKVVLAFSGGLDTTFCAIYLAKDLGLEVHTAVVNTGGFDAEELRKIAAHAQSLGVASHTTLDETEFYYQSCIKYLVFGNVLKNNTYPLSVSAERACQAMAIGQYAHQLGAAYVAHGSTGAGNDQVRFDMIFNTLLPGVEIITPIRDKKLSREEEIAYLKAHGLEMNVEKAKYSINKGLWGTSVGGKETLTSHLPLPEEAWPTPMTATQGQDLSLHFEKGEFMGINGMAYPTSVEAIQALQTLAQPYGIGRDIHVGDTIIGIKGRVGFEAAAPMLIIKAHHLLEKHTLTKGQLALKDQLSAWYGNQLHEGQFLDPAMRNVEAFFQSTQENVTGTVFLRLEPWRYTLTGMESPHDLMASTFGQYGEMNNAWTGDDVKGFARIFGNQNMMYHLVNRTEHVTE
jgi:argininosuccinate synthase